MAYLDIIKELEEELSGEGHTGFECISTACEKSELSEKSASTAPPLLGRKNDRGEMVMTIEDLPELEYRLRVSGWRVERRGNELICRSGRKLRVQ
jgi:hypothetical protein